MPFNSLGVVIDDKKFMLIIGAEAQMYDFNGIYQNFPPKGKWREGDAAIGICDGGPANFSVLYDLNAKTFRPIRSLKNWRSGHIHTKYEIP